MSDIAKSEATSFLEEKAAGLAVEFGSLLTSLTPIQREFVKKMAILKASETSELSFDEIIELGEIVSELAKLNLEITEELSGFWTKLGDIAKESALKFTKVGLRMAARSVVGFLPI